MKRLALLILLTFALFAVEYVLISNGMITGGLYSSDTGRLSAWPTLLPVRLVGPFVYALRPILLLVVFPADIPFRVVVAHCNRHPDAPITMYLQSVFLNPAREHRLYVLMAAFSAATWLMIIAVGVRLFRRARRAPSTEAA